MLNEVAPCTCTAAPAKECQCQPKSLAGASASAYVIPFLTHLPAGILFAALHALNSCAIRSIFPMRRYSGGWAEAVHTIHLAKSRWVMLSQGSYWLAAIHPTTFCEVNKTADTQSEAATICLGQEKHQLSWIHCINKQGVSYPCIPLFCFPCLQSHHSEQCQYCVSSAACSTLHYTRHASLEQQKGLHSPSCANCNALLPAQRPVIIWFRL